MIHSFRALLVLALLAAAPACHAPEKADAFIAEEAGWSDHGVGKTILLYLPNRIVDLLDVVHLAYGIGPGFGLELHLTRYGRLGAVAGVDAGIGWLSRHTSPWQAAIYARATAGPLEALASPHGLKRTSSPRIILWRQPKWDIGVYLHALIDMLYVGVAPDEIVDFVAGLITYDTKDDDF